jgi:hypothetical protein
MPPSPKKGSKMIGCAMDADPVTHKNADEIH